MMIEKTRSNGTEYTRGRDAWNENGCGETSEWLKIGDAYVVISICQGINNTWISMYQDEGDGRQRSLPCVLDLEDVRETSSLLMA